MPASDSDEDVRGDAALDGPLREREEYVLKAIAQRHGISRTVRFFSTSQEGPAVVMMQALLAAMKPPVGPAKSLWLWLHEAGVVCRLLSIIGYA